MSNSEEGEDIEKQCLIAQSISMTLEVSDPTILDEDEKRIFIDLIFPLMTTYCNTCPLYGDKCLGPRIYKIDKEKKEIKLVPNMK